MTAPYHVVQAKIKEAGGNPAALLGDVLAFEKLVLNLVNRQDPNSIASQMSELMERGLLDYETVHDFVQSVRKIKNRCDETRKAVNFFSQEYKNKNPRDEKPKLDLEDNVIPLKKKQGGKTSNRFSKLEID